MTRRRRRSSGEVLSAHALSAGQRAPLRDGQSAHPASEYQGRAQSPRWITIRPSRGWLPRLDIDELWAYRELVRALAVRDLKLRYKQTAFGIAWALIQPFTAAVIFTIIFGRLADLPSDGFPYPLFVYTGLALWMYHSNAVQSAAECLVENNKLVTNVYFPRILAPLAAVLPGLVDFASSLVVVAALMAVYGVSPNWPLVLLPAWLAGAIALAFGTGLWLSALNVLYRDVRYAFGFLIQVWLFASPIIFPSSLVKGTWRYVFALNPVVGLVDGFRWSLLGGSFRGSEAAVSVAAVLLLVAGGAMFFRGLERRFADVV